MTERQIPSILKRYIDDQIGRQIAPLKEHARINRSFRTEAMESLTAIEVHLDLLEASIEAVASADRMDG